MKAKKLKNLVNKARNELSWPVREVAQASGRLSIFSDPMACNHTLFLPAGQPETGQPEELIYLHELGHALLCERVHPFFSTAFPIEGLDAGLLPAVAPLLGTASDWFVGQWFMEFCPEVALAELKKEFAATAAMMDTGETPDVDRFFVAVLIIAQARMYLKERAECEGFLEAAVRAFLAVPPDKPTIGKLEELFNRLLALGAPYRCRRTSEEGRDVLAFYPAAEGRCR